MLRDTRKVYILVISDKLLKILTQKVLKFKHTSQICPR